MQELRRFFPLATAARKLAAGMCTNVVITSDGLYAWGYGDSDYATYKTDTPQKIEAPDFVAVATYLGHSLALTAEGELYAWGDNTFRQLGLATGQRYHIPQKVTLPIPGDSRLIDIAVGERYSLALTSEGELYAWGYGENGQLGLGRSGESESATWIEVGRRQPRNNFGKVQLPPVAAISVNISHSLAVTRDGQVYHWGSDSDGLSGTRCHSTPELVYVPTPVVAVAGGHGFSLALTVDGEVYSWSDCNYGSPYQGECDCPVECDCEDECDCSDKYDEDRECNCTIEEEEQRTPRLIELPEPAAAIAAGGIYSLAVTVSGKVYTWDSRKDSDMTPRKLELSGVVGVAAGSDHSLAVTVDGSVYTWGNNTCRDTYNTLTDMTGMPVKVELPVVGV